MKTEKKMNILLLIVYESIMFIFSAMWIFARWISLDIPDNNYDEAKHLLFITPIFLFSMLLPFLEKGK